MRTLAHLTKDEQEAVRRAELLLERTYYDEGERVTDARMCARYLLEAMQSLNDERSARRSLQERQTAREGPPSEP